MKTENIFELIPEDLDDELMETLVQNKNAKIQRIVSKGHTSPATGWYDQEYDEWVLVITGAAIVAFDKGQDIALKQGDYLTIPAHVKHKVKWTDPQIKTIWLAVHF